MTREEAIAELKRDIELENDFTEDYINAVKMAIEALEQEKESVLDKIRAEIEKAVWEDSIYSFDDSNEVIIQRLDPEDVFEIIDKYKRKVRLRNEYICRVQTWRNGL